MSVVEVTPIRTTPRRKARGWSVKRGPRDYEARWYDHDGKRRAKTGFERKSDSDRYAKAQAREVSKIQSGELASWRPATVDALLDLFEERHGRTVDPATARKLKQQLKHAREKFGTQSPEGLRKADLEDWRLELPPGSRHDVFRAFRQALTWASDPDRALIERDASRGIKNPKRKRHERREVFPFESWEEIDALSAELDARYSALPAVVAGTGPRPEEWIALHRSDVFYDDENERGRFHIHQRFTGGVLKPGTKTEPERFVPFGRRVYRALKAMPVRIDTPILFPAPRGGYIDIEKFRYREWTPALRAAGLPHHRVYDLRHTYASWALAMDVPAAKLAKIMGTSIAQIEDTYHRFLKSDDLYGSAVDGYGLAVAEGAS